MSRITGLAVLTAALGYGSVAGAFEVKHTDGGKLVSWRRSSVTWTVDRSVSELPGGREAVTAAVDAWTQRAGAPSLSVAKMDATLEPGFDGVNGIFYAADGYAPAGDALAVTLLKFDAETGAVVEADIVINGKYRFAPIAQGGAPVIAPQSADRSSGVYDIDRVLAHEMGHALALSDEPELETSLMYPYVPRARVLATVPAEDDLAGLKVLYATGAAHDAPATAPPRGGCSIARALGTTGTTSTTRSTSVTGTTDADSPWKSLGVVTSVVTAAIVVALRRRRTVAAATRYRGHGGAG